MSRPDLPTQLAGEHLEEAGFLLQSQLSPFPGGSALATADRDERLDAHLDGLRFSGNAGLAVMVAGLRSFDDDIVLAAEFALASLPELDGALDAAVAGLVAADEREPATWSAICVALRHASHPELDARLRPLLAHARAEVRASVIDVLGYRRTVTPEHLWPLLHDGDRRVGRSAFAALARVGGLADLPALEQVAFGRIEGPTEDERWALLRMGSRPAFEQCRDIVAVGDPQPRDLTLLALAGTPAELPLLLRQLATDRLRVAAADALGILGELRAVPALIGLLGHPDDPTRAAAGAALELISGAGLRETVERREPAPAPLDVGDAEPPEPPEADEISRVDRPTTAAGPWVDWWRVHGARFGADRRYRRGRLFSLSQCLDDLGMGASDPASAALDDHARRCTRALVELEIRSRHRLPFDHDAPAPVQRRQLAVWRDWWQGSARAFPDGGWPPHGRHR